MMRDYEIVSPSLEGVLNHASLGYEGIVRPVEIMRVLDGPAARGRKKDGARDEPKDDIEIKKIENDRKVLEDYFHDVYGVFMKKFSHFIVDGEVDRELTIQLQAMLQELIKVKRMIWELG